MVRELGEGFRRLVNALSESYDHGVAKKVSIRNVIDLDGGYSG
jgi:hypothetical protein